MSKVVGTYTGRFDVYMKKSNIKIQIISVPKQKNKIVMTSQGSFKNINGSLLGIKKLIHDEKSLGWDLKPTKMYGLSIRYQNRGSHQGGPMHNFKDIIALFSKDEKQIDKLLKFLEKHITKKKVRRTIKRGGGKKHYGIRGNNVIELYPHRIPRSIGRHKYIISWKTTKENLPNKTFHGKFYKSKEEAKEHTKSKRKKK